MSVVIDSYTPKWEGSGFPLHNGGYTKVAQSFVAVTNILLSDVRFAVSLVGSPTGNAVAKIYAHSGTLGVNSVPTGDALATSDSVDITEIINNTAIFTFSNHVTIGDGYYCVSVEYSGGDGDNFLNVYIDDESPEHVGNASTYSGGWSADNLSDILFVVYGDYSPLLNTKYPLPAFKRP